MNVSRQIKKAIFRLRTKLVSGNKRAELYRPYLYHLGNNCEFYTTNLGNELYLLNIHDHVILANNCNLIEHDYSTACVSKIIGYNVGKIGSIELCDNCFVGANATIMPGVKIGESSIIAAGSVVTKNIPAGEVWGGGYRLSLLCQLKSMYKRLFR